MFVLQFCEIDRCRPAGEQILVYQKYQILLAVDQRVRRDYFINIQTVESAVCMAASQQVMDRGIAVLLQNKDRLLMKSGETGQHLCEGIAVCNRKKRDPDALPPSDVPAGGVCGGPPEV